MSHVLKAVIVAIFFLLSLLWIGGTPLSRDGDTWFHWISGDVQTRSLSERLSLSREDQFSYTTAGQPRELHSWLGQIAIAGVGGWGGHSLMVLRLCLWSGLLALLLGVKSNRSSPPVVWFVIAGALYAVLRETGDLRPSLFGAFFIYGFCLWVGEERPKAWSGARVLTIAGVGILAVNVHGSGLILSLLALALTMVNRRWWPLAVILVISSFVNPRGLWVWKDALELARAANALGVGEWQSLAPLDFKSGNLVVRLSVLHLLWWGTGITLLWRLKGEGLQASSKKRWECLVSTIFVAAPLMSTRHLLFLPLATALQVRWLLAIREATVPSNPKLRMAVSLAGLSLISLLWPTPSTYFLPQSPVRFPLRAMAFLEESEISGNAFNELTWAGMILQASHQKIRVALDCQAKLHREDFRRLREVEKDKKVITLSSVSELFPQTNILIHRSDLDWGDSFRRDWVNVYQNEVATISLKKTRANEENFDRVNRFYEARGLSFDKTSGVRVSQLWRLSQAREALFEVENQTWFASPSLRAQTVLRQVEWLAREGLWEAATDVAKQNLSDGVWSTALAVRMGSLLVAQQRFPEAKQWIGFLNNQDVDKELTRPLRVAIGRWEQGKGWGDDPKYLFTK